MRKTSRRLAAKSTLVTLREIQEQMREMCESHYDEFYRVTTERGFTKITIPKATTPKRKSSSR
jgi:hypothetical protein